MVFNTVAPDPQLANLSLKELHDKIITDRMAVYVPIMQTLLNTVQAHLDSDVAASTEANDTKSAALQAQCDSLKAQVKDLQDKLASIAKVEQAEAAAATSDATEK